MQFDKKSDPNRIVNPWIGIPNVAPAVDVQNATNKVTFAKSTPSDAFYYTCTSNGL